MWKGHCLWGMNYVYGRHKHTSNGVSGKGERGQDEVENNKS